MWCKLLIKNKEWLFLQLWTKRSHERIDQELDTMRRALPWWRIEEWETYTEALIRETFEETWVAISDTLIEFLWSLMTSITLDIQNEWFFGLFLNYYQYSIHTEFIIILSDEHEEYRRVTLDQIKLDLQKVAEYPDAIWFL